MCACVKLFRSTRSSSEGLHTEMQRYVCIYMYKCMYMYMWAYPSQDRASLIHEHYWDVNETGINSDDKYAVGNKHVASRHAPRDEEYLSSCFSWDQVILLHSFYKASTQLLDTHWGARLDTCVMLQTKQFLAQKEKPAWHWNVSVNGSWMLLTIGFTSYTSVAGTNMYVWDMYACLQLLVPKALLFVTAP